MNPPNICAPIVKCLENVWNDKMFFDFSVKITDVTIECHRVILAGCSDFFRGLFRSGMREVTENCVALQDVSCDVFQLILKTIYTGENILNSENLFEVWRAVHQLQITFMVNLCENFAIELIAMDIWEKIYTNASILGSERVLNQTFTFMLNNFDQISLSLTFLQLSYTEVRDLVKNQALVVRSEDVVFGAVIKWVDHALIDGTNQYVDLSNDSKTTIDNSNFICETDTYQSEINVSVQNLNQETYNELDSGVEILNNDDSSSNDVAVKRNSSRKDKLTSLLKLVRIYQIVNFLERKL
ncbi:kelch-like protein 40b [Physella acuta]|uniref:kelch-like protein 40b n=1 Tax=Physella acuta TaxID=109671 RepID=UPI0027DE290C|nr:kelch-like protein 40b [Physella acuta]